MDNKDVAIGLVLAFLAGGALTWSLQQLQGHQTEAASMLTSDKDAQLPVPVDPEDPTWGSPDAPVTIVVFSDYQCPFCGRLENTLHIVRKTYGPKQVRIVWKQFPLHFHEHARPAAMASATVYGLGGNKAFWPFHDLAFSHQSQLDREHFIAWATKVGVDKQKFTAALDSNRFAAKIERDIALGRTLGIHGTPHAIVNGIAVHGAQPFNKFQTVIEQQLAEAKELLRSGTKPSKLYERLLRKNWGSEAQSTKKRANEKKKATAPKDNTVWRVPIGNSPVRGSNDAPVTIVLFSDFQCPFCKRVEPTLDRLLKEYDGKVRIVWKDRPLSFHPRAEPCAEFARAVRALKGDAGFWEAHRLLFESNPNLDDADLKKIARKLGVPWATIADAMETGKYSEPIDDDNELGQRLQANGTPQMFINGKRLIGALPYETIKKVVDEQLKKAENLMNGGTPASGVYDKIMAKAKQPPPAPEPPKRHLPKSMLRGPWKGDRNGSVMLQLISDFQCPFCRQVEPTIAQLLARHPKQLKVVWINNPLPFHQHAMLAAEAAEEVLAQKGNDAFWRYHDMLFENQRQPHGLEREALEQYARKLGCDMERFRAALDSHKHRDKLEKQQKLVAEADIKGTPGIIINGYYINGARPMATFERAIKRSLRDLRSGKHSKN